MQKNIVISAGGGYCTSGGEDKGFLIYRPYKDCNLFSRVLREIWFRIGLPESAWYNKKILKIHPNTISVKDCLITTDYLKWLKLKFPYAEIVFHYDNLVGKAKHLLPNQIPEGISVTTYDPADSERYNLGLTSGGEFPVCNLRDRLPNEYDVFYVGADKGRAEYILELKEKMENMGLKTKIIITKNGRLSRRKRFYSKAIPYDKVLEYDCKSKAILNVILPGQTGATMRDFEALFLKSKLITNNPCIKNYDFYKKENIFILGEDNIDELPRFVNSEFIEASPDILKKHMR